MVLPAEEVRSAFEEAPRGDDVSLETERVLKVFLFLGYRLLDRLRQGAAFEAAGTAFEEAGTTFEVAGTSFEEAGITFEDAGTAFE